MDSEGQLVKKLSDISLTIGKEKVKTETFEYHSREYGSIKSIALIFMIEDVTSDGEQRFTHCHVVLNLEIHYQCHLLKNLPGFT